MPESQIFDELAWERARQRKIAERQALLVEHPELRLKLGRKEKRALKKIVDYLDFKVASSSSITRGEAIRGSDLDGGLVITKAGERTSARRQRRFVQKLRSFGFAAADIREQLTTEQAYKEALATPGFPEKEINKRRHKAVVAEAALISFLPQDELEKRLTDQTLPERLVDIRLRGTSIG